jgi:ribosome-associated toxin RatA of RatAB toxin-antitoxin module
MVTVERSALVGYSATDLYTLVEAVEAYPDFLPWCAAAQVVSRDGPSAVVTLHIRYRGLRQHFTTRNTFAAGKRIEMSLVDGPFRSLDGEWRFTPLHARSCRVDLTLAYELRSGLLARLMGPAFDQIANTFVDAFVQRADDLYAVK